MGENNRVKKTTIATNSPADPANRGKPVPDPPFVSGERGNRGYNRRPGHLDAVHDEA